MTPYDLKFNRIEPLCNGYKYTPANVCSRWAKSLATPRGEHRPQSRSIVWPTAWPEFLCPLRILTVRRRHQSCYLKKEN